MTQIFTSFKINSTARKEKCFVWCCSHCHSLCFCRHTLCPCKPPFPWHCHFLHTETEDGCLMQSMTGTELPVCSSPVVQLEEHLQCSSLSQGGGLLGMHRALQKGVGWKISKDLPKLMISVCYLLLRDKKWKVWRLCPTSGIILQKNKLKGNWEFSLFVMFWYLIRSWKNCFSEL